MADIERALDTSVGSTGAYLLPEVVDPTIRDYVSLATPLLATVTRVPWPTQTYWVRKMTALPTSIGWRADGGTLPSAGHSTFARDSKNIKYVYGRAEVTGPMQAASGGVVNAIQTEITNLSRALAMDLTDKLVTGDSSNDPYEFDGMLAQINASTPGDEGGTIDKSNATLSLSMLDEAIDATRGECDVILTSRTVRRKINALLQGQQRFTESITVNGGFRVLSYDGVPILTDLNWEDDDKIIFFRRADAKLLVNKDWTFSPLAKTKDSDDFMIAGYFGFALEGRPVLLTDFAL